MDDSGDVVLQISEQTTRCSSPAVVYCYETFTNGVFQGLSNTAPTFAWDFDYHPCVVPQPVSAPCVVTDNGWTAMITANPGGGESLFGYYGSNAPQLITTGGFASFAINGDGLIVFDQGVLDFWAEASVPTPEPDSIVLLATGILGIAGAARLRFFFHSQERITSFYRLGRLVGGAFFLLSATPCALISVHN